MSENTIVSESKGIARRYQFTGNSPVTSIEVEELPNGKNRYYIYAENTATQHEIANLPLELCEKEIYGAYPDVKDNRNALVIASLGKDEQLLEALKSVGAVRGPSNVEELDDGKDKSAIGRMKEQTLQLAGKVGLAGHAAIAAKGILQGDLNLIMGSMGALNPIILSVYGSGNHDAAFDRIVNNMRDYFIAEGVEVPEEKMREPKRNFLQSVEKLVSEHPLQVGFALGNIGAINLFINAVKNGDWKQLSIASTSIVGNTVVMFVPEKTHDRTEEEKAEQNILQKFADYVQESPLRFNGLFNFSDNIMWGWKALDEFTKRDKLIAKLDEQIVELKGKVPEQLENLQQGFHTGNYDAVMKDSNAVENILTINKLEKDKKFLEEKGQLSAILTSITAVSFGLSTALASISSKNDSEATKNSQYDKLFASSAKLLVSMAPEERDIVLDRMVTFLSVQDEVKQGKISTDFIKDSIAGKIAILEQSPWIESYKQRAQQQQAELPIQENEIVANNIVPFRQSSEMVKQPATAQNEMIPAGVGTTDNTTPASNITEVQRQSLEKLLAQTQSTSLAMQ